MMIKFSRIEKFLCDILKIPEDVFLQKGILILPYVNKDFDNIAHIFFNKERCVISINEKYRNTIEKNIKEILFENLKDINDIKKLFNNQIEKVTEVLFQSYLEQKDFLLVDLKNVIGIKDNKDLLDLKNECDSIEWYNSGLNNPGFDIFGYFYEKKLVSVAHYNIWAKNIASIGVITHPEYRGKGFGKKVITASIQEALEKGFLVLYQTSVNNNYSIQLANSLGFKEYGLSVKYYLKNN